MAAVQNLGFSPLALRRNADEEFARILALGGQGGSPRVIPATGSAPSRGGSDIEKGLNAIGGMVKTFAGVQEAQKRKGAATDYVATMLDEYGDAEPETGADLLDRYGMPRTSPTYGSVDHSMGPNNVTTLSPDKSGADLLTVNGAGEARLQAPDVANALDPNGDDRELWTLAMEEGGPVFSSYVTKNYPDGLASARSGVSRPSNLNSIPAPMRSTLQYLVNAGDPEAAARLLADWSMKGPASLSSGDLVKVPGPDGRPMYVPATQAVGQAAYERPRDPKADPLEWVTNRETGQSEFVPRSVIASAPGNFSKADDSEVHFFDSEAGRVLSYGASTQTARSLAEQVANGSTRYIRQASAAMPDMLTLIHPKRPGEPVSVYPNTPRHRQYIEAGYYAGRPSQRSPLRPFNMTSPDGNQVLAVTADDPRLAELQSAGWTVQRGSVDVFDALIGAALAGRMGQGASQAATPVSSTPQSPAPSAPPVGGRPSAGGAAVDFAQPPVPGVDLSGADPEMVAALDAAAKAFAGAVDPADARRRINDKFAKAKINPAWLDFWMSRPQP